MAFLKYKWKSCNKYSCKCILLGELHGPYIYFRPNNEYLNNYNSPANENGYIYLGSFENALMKVRGSEFFKRWRRSKKDSFLKAFHQLKNMSEISDQKTNSLQF